MAKNNKLERLEHLGEGNIESSTALLPPIKSLKTAKKQGNQKLKYDFTYNNYNPNDLEHLERFLYGLCKKFVFQEEISESGTPHLQGAIWLHKRARMSELVKFKELKHCSFREVINWKALSRYCQLEISEEKPFGRIKNGKIFKKNVLSPKKVIKILKDQQLYKWQLNIISLIKTEADDRTIHWFYEKKGNVGKTTFCKYLVIKYNVIVLSGKASDMKFGIVKYIEKNGDYPNIVVLDITRTREEFLSYTGIEEIKNGLFFSGKYESDMVIGNCPHLIIFANFKPEISAMSADRWKITLINESK